MKTPTEILMRFRKVCFHTRDQLYKYQQVSTYDLQLATNQALEQLDTYYREKYLALVGEDELTYYNTVPTEKDEPEFSKNKLRAELRAAIREGK